MAKTNILQQCAVSSKHHSPSKEWVTNRVQARVAESQPTARSPKGEAVLASSQVPRRSQGHTPWSFNDRSQRAQRRGPEGSQCRVLNSGCPVRWQSSIPPGPEGPRDRITVRYAQNAGDLTAEADAAPRRRRPRGADEDDCVREIHAAYDWRDTDEPTYRPVVIASGPKTVNSNLKPRRPLAPQPAP